MQAPPRWVVLDVESSGLDPARDRLLAIAAVAVEVAPGRPHIACADSFEVLGPADADIDAIGQPLARCFRRRSLRGTAR